MRTVEDVDLLRLEMRTLWESDAYGRLRPSPLLAIAVAGDGHAFHFGPDLPDDLRTAFSGEIEDAQALLEEYRKRLSRPTRIEGGPSYSFGEGTSIPILSDLTISTSDEEVPQSLVDARPDPWWEPDEWRDLLAGRLGPWAIGHAEERVASLCHTPVGATLAAEAGVWTHPEWRGRGYAPTVTAAWARVARLRFETLFYSTGANNAASQAVARKLGLRPIGWIWQLRSDG